MNDIVALEAISKYYGGQAALKNISLAFKEGEIHGVIGPNGSGKTTLLKLLTHLATPSEGRIIEKQNILQGSLLEHPGLFTYLTAADNLKLKMLALGLPASPSGIESLLDKVDLRGVENKKVKHYSLGMRQRLGLAMALVGDPEILFLDEPINGLDPTGIIEIRSLLQALNQKEGKTVIISSHLLNELEKLATYFTFLNRGELLYHEPKAVLKQDLQAANNDIEVFYAQMSRGGSNG